jgi:hypothetical protein
MSEHVEFYSKNKFEKLVHLVDFIIGINIHPACLLVLVSPDGLVVAAEYT